MGTTSVRVLVAGKEDRMDAGELARVDTCGASDRIVGGPASSPTGRYEELPERIGYKRQRDYAWSLLSKHANGGNQVP